MIRGVSIFLPIAAGTAEKSAGGVGGQVALFVVGLYEGHRLSAKIEME
jgi:hypothetical protein